MHGKDFKKFVVKLIIPLPVVAAAGCDIQLPASRDRRIESAIDAGRPVVPPSLDNYWDAAGNDRDGVTAHMNLLIREHASDDFETSRPRAGVPLCVARGDGRIVEIGHDRAG